MAEENSTIAQAPAVIRRRSGYLNYTLEKVFELQIGLRKYKRRISFFQRKLVS